MGREGGKSFRQFLREKEGKAILPPPPSDRGRADSHAQNLRARRGGARNPFPNEHNLQQRRLRKAYFKSIWRLCVFFFCPYAKVSCHKKRNISSYLSNCIYIFLLHCFCVQDKKNFQFQFTVYTFYDSGFCRRNFLVIF